MRSIFPPVRAADTPYPLDSRLGSWVFVPALVYFVRSRFFAQSCVLVELVLWYSWFCGSRSFVVEHECSARSSRVCR